MWKIISPASSVERRCKRAHDFTQTLVGNRQQIIADIPLDIAAIGQGRMAGTAEQPDALLLRDPVADIGRELAADRQMEMQHIALRCRRIRLQLNPSAPQSNMLHLHLPVSRELATDIRDRIAQQQGVWLFGRASHAALPDRSYIEWYVGDNLLAISDQRLREIMGTFA